MKRLLALVAAAAMIVGALYFRGYFEGDGDGGGLTRDRSPLHVICVPELKAACEALADEGVTVTVQEAGQTAAALSEDAPVEADAWLTLQPWPAMVVEAREREVLEPVVEEPIPVGRSPLVMTVWQERGAVIAKRCKGDIAWGCIGKQAAKRWEQLGGETGWGGVKVGFSDPTLSASGLLVLGQATSDFFGTSDLSTRELESPAFATWLRDLNHAVPSHGTSASTPLGQVLQRGRATYDFVGTTEAEAGPAVERTAPGRRQGLELQRPEPVVVAEAVLAPLNPEAGDRLRKLVVERGGAALAAAGWRVEGQPAAAGINTAPVPPAADLPSAGALEALRLQWEEITR